MHEPALCMLQGVKKVAAATFLSKRTAVCGRRFSSVSAWSLCSRTADLQGNFSPEARKTRPGGKAAGYDDSQRACEPSDTSRVFFDSLRNGPENQAVPDGKYQHFASICAATKEAMFSFQPSSGCTSPCSLAIRREKPLS